MSAVSDALQRYFTTIEGFGATVHHRLRSPATDTELTRLEGYMGVDLPQEVRDWYNVFNGTDLNHPETTSTSSMMFPILAPVSIEEVFEVRPWYMDYTEAIDPSFTYATQVGIPILRTHGDEAMLLADCSSPSTRYITWSGGEGYLADAGYYHESLVGFIDGARRHAEAGRFESISGGVFVKENLYSELATRYSNPTVVQRLHYGFELDDRPVPRFNNLED